MKAMKFVYWGCQWEMIKDRKRERRQLLGLFCQTAWVNIYKQQERHKRMRKMNCTSTESNFVWWWWPKTVSHWLAGSWKIKKKKRKCKYSFLSCCKDQADEDLTGFISK